MIFHESVLLNESIEGLITNANGIYVDVTFGAGGHSKLILDLLDKEGELFAFDRDADAHELIPIKDGRLCLIRCDFKYLKEYLHYYGIDQVDGVLADLGLSSHQLNSETRGFAFRFDGELDMRMNVDSPLRASDILNDYPIEELQRVFWRYGELKNGRYLASVVNAQRKIRSFKTVEDFVQRIKPAIKGLENKYLAKVFQALRIEVNGEMVALETMLHAAKDLIKPGGRLVAISYHSLEDRMVKNLIKAGNISGEIEEDDFGRKIKYFTPLHKGVIEATEDEIRTNSRARSAKMRIAERI